MIRVIIIYTLFLFHSCHNIQPENKKSEVQRNEWDFLKIRVDKETFYVSSNQDACYYYPPLATNEQKKSIDEQKINSVKIVLSKAERDSLFSLATEAITSPIITNQEVTCYSGQYVTISLEKMNTTVTCNYASISDWTKISSTFKKINSMTFEKVKRNK